MNLKSGRIVASALLVSLLAGGCFPHEPEKRFVAKIVEGGTLAIGVLILALTKSGADCDVQKPDGEIDDSGCHDKYGTISNLGLAMVLGGVTGFVATVVTAEDDPVPVVTAPLPVAPVAPAVVPVVPPTPTPTPTPTPAPPPAAGSGSSAVSE